MFLRSLVSLRTTRACTPAWDVCVHFSVRFFTGKERYGCISLYFNSLMQGQGGSKSVLKCDLPTWEVMAVVVRMT